MSFVLGIEYEYCIFNYTILHKMIHKISINKRGERERESKQYTHGLLLFALDTEYEYYIFMYTALLTITGQND